MKVFYSDFYTLQLPEEHRFPMSKYKMLRNYLIEHEIIREEQLNKSPLAEENLLRLAHDPMYVQHMKNGTVPIEIIKRVGFPWSYDLYLRSCATVGGAVAAAESALSSKVAGNLAGGTHHAHFDRGEGYCVFNDIAVATRKLHTQYKNLKIAIIDLDVHQGNGNSSILSQDKNVFILSLHGEKNYPFKKVPSHFDIGLPDGTSDEAYLEALNHGMSQIEKFKPDFIFYQMGVDPLKEDKLGKLNLSFEGLMQRDRKVLNYAFKNQIPLSLALGGGYAHPIELSVIAYANTYRVVNEIYN